MSRISALLSSLCGVVLFAPTPVLAQEPDAVERSEDLATSRPEQTLHGQLRISLADAIAMGIENNLDVEVARHNPLIAYQDHEIAWGAYDPTLSAEYGYAWNERKVLNVLQVGTELDKTLDWSSGVQGEIPRIGATYGFQYGADRVTTDREVALLSPEYRADMRFTLSIPLMRDLLWNQSWTEVKTTGVVYAGERENFRRELIDTVREIEGAYWGLVAAKDGVRVAQKSLETARELFDQTKIQYDVGVVSRVEVTEAEAGVAERDFNLIVSENQYRRAQDTLIDLVLGPTLTPDSRLEFEPTDDPENTTVYDINLNESARKAFANRPELGVARYEIERQEIQLRFAENQRRPRLDAQGSYGYGDLAGRGKEARFGGTLVPAPPINQSIRKAHDDFFSGNGAKSWSARGVFSIPLGNHVARHRVTRSRIELRRANTQLRRLQQTIILEVRDAARNLESAQEGIEAAKRRQVAAAEQLRAERVRLEHGESTPFNVLDRERDLVEAANQKIGALQIYHVSVADLDRAQGTTLDSRKIRVDEAVRLR